MHSYWEEHLLKLDGIMAFYSSNGHIHINTDTEHASPFELLLNAIVRLLKISVSPGFSFIKQLYQYHASLLISVRFVIRDPAAES